MRIEGKGDLVNGRPQPKPAFLHNSRENPANRKLALDKQACVCYYMLITRLNGLSEIVHK